MEIRKCRHDEIQKTGEFYDSVVEYLDSHINYPKWIYKVYPSEGYAKDMTGKGCQYIVEDAGQIVAAFALNDDPEGDYQKAGWGRNLHDGEYMVIHALAVTPGMHKTGIGKRIVGFCIDKAKEEGYKGIRLDFVPGNEPAKHLYEGCGFSYVGDEDVRPEIEHIPYFSLLEMYFDDIE